MNGWCSIPSAVTAEIVARQGFDCITVDLQHGLIDYQTALTMLQVVDRYDVPTLCRVPWNEPGIIMKALDAGFTGIICPMINNRDDAVRFAAACRYAPRGIRSYGPTRARELHGDDYGKTAHEFIAAFAMIETAEALANVDDILAVDDVDGVYIGPADLALSLGYEPTLLSTDAEVITAIATIRQRAKAAGKTAGIHCASPEMVRQKFDEGFDFAALSTDVRLFTTTMSSQLALARSGAAKPAASGQY